MQVLTRHVQSKFLNVYDFGMKNYISQPITAQFFKLKYCKSRNITASTHISLYIYDCVATIVATIIIIGGNHCGEGEDIKYGSSSWAVLDSGTIC